MTVNTDYDVGYAKPPVATQFKKGQSGNPKGGKKGPRKPADVIAAAMAEKVSVMINGRRRTISKFEAAATQLANQAAGGDRHATKLVFDVLTFADVREEARIAGAPPVSDRSKADEAILNAFFAKAAEALPEVQA